MPDPESLPAERPETVPGQSFRGGKRAERQPTDRSAPSSDVESMSTWHTVRQPRCE